ncbi:hypothetical protein CUU54_06805 [Pectobacterium polaris]|uniref:hypothetical protein n=1 Tax=Pectobacterium polaris TaxID=2042057 RepID=UPI000D6169F2|nr:hypothetical protein [Pectobacterium polaris]MCU1788568.1 hypothetical protein [Pectobacterium polaris]PWD61751.1 hypothetical protein DF209_07360 [Pectobacterium polaris]
MSVDEISFDELGYNSINVGIHFLWLISDDRLINDKHKEGMSEKEMKKYLMNMMIEWTYNCKKSEEIRREYISIVDTLIDIRISNWRSKCHCV